MLIFIKHLRSLSIDLLQLQHFYVLSIGGFATSNPVRSNVLYILNGYSPDNQNEEKIDI